MKNLYKISRSQWIRLMLVVIGAGLFMSACSDSSTNNKLGSLPSTSFTATPLSSNPNKVVVQNTTKDAFMYSWDFGNGTSSSQETDTATYINKGDYTIKLTAFGHGGTNTASKDISIATDYKGQNVLPDDGGLKASDWTYLNVPGGGKVNVTYENNTINFTNTSYSYGGIFEAVQVKAGIKYLFSAHIKGSGLGSESWFEIYFGTTKPMQGSDYTDNKFVSLNTYNPCGGSAFDGDLAKIGCSGSGTGKGGVITFSNTGTVYLVIKPGSNGGSLGDGGVTLTSISLSKL